MSGQTRRGEGRTPAEARAFFEHEAVDYAAHYYGSTDPVTRTLKQQRLDLLARLVRECVRPPARVLDVGCAEGHVEAVLPQGLDVVGLDLAAGRVVLARNRAPGLLGVAGDGVALPFQAGIFDLVICSATLDHLPDPFTGMGELARVLRPAGHLLVVLDNRFKLFKRAIRVNQPAIDPNA
ncbi:MAG: class I SAM-dependent methyltransferase, partial [Candidatus Methylomirabilales bacterium]